jgi:hypothetical protein
VLAWFRGVGAGNDRAARPARRKSLLRAWYSVSSKGLLEAAKFVKDFSGEIAGTLKNLGKCFWPDFTLPEK